MNWRIGQKVVCVDDSLCWGTEPCALVRGHHYTIAGIDWARETVGGGAALLISGVLSPQEYWSDHRFRPLAEADLSAELAETFLKGQPPSEQEVYNPQHA